MSVFHFSLMGSPRETDLHLYRLVFFPWMTSSSKSPELILFQSSLTFYLTSLHLRQLFPMWILVTEIKCSYTDLSFVPACRRFLCNLTQFLKAVSENCHLPHASSTSSSVFLLYVCFFTISQAISFIFIFLLSLIKSKIPIVLIFFYFIVFHEFFFPNIFLTLSFFNTLLYFSLSLTWSVVRPPEKLVNQLSLLISLRCRAVLISKGNAMGMMGLSVSASHSAFGAKDALRTSELSEGVFLGKIHESFNHPQQKQVYYVHGDHTDFGFPCSSEVRTLPTIAVSTSYPFLPMIPG